uniref:Ig-like domain-containing protein n=1 Tax=Glossina austeni TaxID=7395 RepID=A0A1A9UND2_GLOAU
MCDVIPNSVYCGAYISIFVKITEHILGQIFKMSPLDLMIDGSNFCQQYNFKISSYTRLVPCIKPSKERIFDTLYRKLFPHGNVDKLTKNNNSSLGTLTKTATDTLYSMFIMVQSFVKLSKLFPLTSVKAEHLRRSLKFDARGRSLHQAIPWADENIFKNKAHFYYDSNPPALRVKNIQTSDAGLYKCRVDFHKSPTRNWRINVTVLVPPKNLAILDHQGAEVRDQKAGPYLEGDSINLTCLSSGGIPPPRVSWWREHALVDDSFQVLPDGTVRNVLHLKNISRKDLLTIYTCQASNGHVVAALTKKVMLDMNCNSKRSQSVGLAPTSLESLCNKQGNLKLQRLIPYDTKRTGKLLLPSDVIIQIA